MDNPEIQPEFATPTPIAEEPASEGSSIDEEIESLLRDAVELTEVITSNLDDAPEVDVDSNSDSEPVQAMASPPVSPVEAEMAAPTPAPEPDPEPIAEDSAEIDSILNEVEASIGEAQAAASLSERNLPDLLNDPEGAADLQAEPVREVLYIPDDDFTDESAEENAPQEIEQSEPTPPPVEAARAEAPAAQAPSPEVTAPESTDAELPVKRTAAPAIVARCLGVLGKFVATIGVSKRVAARAPSAAIGLMGNMLAFLNIPFTKISDPSRNAIGIIAVATLICGVLSWILPWLLVTNPFEHIPPGVVTGQ